MSHAIAVRAMFPMRDGAYALLMVITDDSTQDMFDFDYDGVATLINKGMESFKDPEQVQFAVYRQAVTAGKTAAGRGLVNFDWDWNRLAADVALYLTKQAAETGLDKVFPCQISDLDGTVLGSHE